MLVTVALSLLAAFVFALSAALQQRAARGEARRAGLDRRGPAWLPVLGVLNRLVRDRRWLAGQLANVAGFAAHAAALHVGSITVVQPLLVVQLLFALALGNRRPLRRDWTGTLLVCAGLAVLLSAHAGKPVHRADRGHLALTVLLAVAAIGGLLVAARFARRRSQARAALVAVAAGICFCLTAVFVGVVAGDLSRGGLAALATEWAVLGLAASTTTGGLLAQDAFAAGTLPTALTAMNITDPTASVLVGTFLLGAGAPAGPGALVAYAGLVSAGVALLANSPTLNDERDRYGAAEVRVSSVSNSASRPATVVDHGNRSAAARAAARLLDAGRATSSRMPSASPLGVPSVIRPESGSPISSAAAPCAGTTAGTPQARASSVASPNVSAGDGDSATSATPTSPAIVRRSET
jgi:hypothetical protein